MIVGARNFEVPARTRPPVKSKASPGSGKSRSEGSASRSAKGTASSREVQYFYVRPCWDTKRSKSRGGMRGRWRRAKMRMPGSRMLDEIFDLLAAAESAPTHMSCLGTNVLEGIALFYWHKHDEQA